MNKILVANRGEIALRIMRTCREMGIKTVAVFSEADRKAPFVQYADEAFLLGPPPSNQSYLLMDKIIEIAQNNAVDGIHPGYGFLSENPVFARKLAKTNIKLIGPSATAMEIMGSKLAAKEAASKFNIPMVPGSAGAVSTAAEAMEIAKKIGFPLLVKASAGGGGKGMRIVEEESQLEEQLTRAMSEAKSAFGDGSVFIERYVASPRHIEIQVLADQHGNFVHLFERECSIQRRHQKVVEEAPSSVVNPELREKMGACALDVARSCKYEGAGTVEFLLDEYMNFYFLEMNTRLQVEHPVTEMITGVDLVREQIEIARGNKISFSQEDLRINGHSIEIRVYAEDPKNNFLPDIGKLVTYQIPKGPGVRVDDGFSEGMDIPIYYDPMISKLIVHAKDRSAAIERMLRAIQDYHISGVKTTLDFCAFAVNHQAFRTGNFDTHFVSRHFKPEVLQKDDKNAMEVAALFAATISNARTDATNTPQQSTVKKSEWKRNRVNLR